MVDSRLEEVFPELKVSGYQIVSPETPSYNCVAWAAGQSHTWWWPDPMGVYFWPRGIPRRETLDAFVSAFKTLGYTVCETADLEPGYEKIAVYVDQEGKPKHTARQLFDGSWTSKLGRLQDITHRALKAISIPAYGNAHTFLKRKTRRS